VRTSDRIIGIVLGIVLGAAIVAGFVFWGSNSTIDNASLGGDGGNAKAKQHDGSGSSSTGRPPVQTIHIEGGAPPLSSGAPTLDYQKDDDVRLNVISDGTVGLELVGYGIDRTVPANQPTLIEFKATKAGNYPLVVTASHIGVADIRIGAGQEP
jgi:hypothetical protein